MPFFRYTDSYRSINQRSHFAAKKKASRARLSTSGVPPETVFTISSIADAPYEAPFF